MACPNLPTQVSAPFIYLVFWNSVLIVIPFLLGSNVSSFYGQIIYKMDKFGQGVEFRCSLLGQNKELNFADFTQQMFLEMCILSGCDYLQSLPGMGLRRAHALIQKFKSYEKVLWICCMFPSVVNHSSPVEPIYFFIQGLHIDFFFSEKSAEW